MKNLTYALQTSFILFVLFLPTAVQALDFKLCNHTDTELRARTIDQNTWTSWVTFQREAYHSIANNVQRNVHQVQIEARTNKGWVRIYTDSKASRIATRVVQVYEDTAGNFQFTWWDKMPGTNCEMPPVHPQRLGQSCLQYSGRFKDNAIASLGQAAVDLLQTVETNNNRNSLTPKTKEGKKQNAKKTALGFVKNAAIIFAQKTVNQETNAYLSNSAQY